MDAIYEFLVKFPVLNRVLKRETFGQFVRYIFVGVVSFSIEYTLFLVLQSTLTLSVLIINTIVTTVIFWINFLLNKFFSFKSKTNFKRQLFMYGILFAFNLVVGNILLFSGIRYSLELLAGEDSWPVLYLPKIIIMFFIISWNFVLYKRIIYK